MLKLISLCTGLVMFANAQTQVTADTLSKGKAAMFASSNALVVKNFTTLTFSTLQYWRGINSKVDAFGGIAATTALGQVQASVVTGANINLLKTKLVNVSAFNTLSTPLYRRQDAATLTWFAAGILSHTFGKSGPSLYGGYSAAMPVGHAADKLFTPPEIVHNVPIGVAIPLGKFLLFVEYNFGRKVQAGGLGAAYAF